VRIVCGVLLLLTACEFPSRAAPYACESNADCEPGRGCDDQGFCVLTLDGGTGEATTLDALGGRSLDATLAPDADLIAAQCQAAGYTFVPAASGYYRVFTAGASWTGAQAACKSHVAGASHLIVLSTTAEVSYMATQLGWVGLSDGAAEGQFVTVTGETGDQRPFQNGQPDNGSGSEDCVQMVSGGQLNDDQCDNDHRYVCECDGRTSTP